MKVNSTGSVIPVKKAVKAMENIIPATFDLFSNDSMMRYATVKQIEIIGEAANRIDPDFKNNHPEIEWRRIKGFRNRIVHDYFGIDFNIVWIIKETFLPDTIVKIKKIDL